ncbi:hypothetical protein [Vreelandella sp. H-I2]
MDNQIPLLVAILAGLVALGGALISRMSKIHEYKWKKLEEIKELVQGLCLDMKKISSISSAKDNIRNFDLWIDNADHAYSSAGELKLVYENLYGNDFTPEGYSRLIENAESKKFSLIMNMNFFNHFLMKRKRYFKKYKQNVDVFFGDKEARFKKEYLILVERDLIDFCKKIDKELSTLTLLEYAIILSILGGMGLLLYIIGGGQFPYGYIELFDRFK